MCKINLILVKNCIKSTFSYKNIEVYENVPKLYSVRGFLMQCFLIDSFKIFSFEKWVHICSLEDEVPAIAASPHSYLICTNHFTDDDYSNKIRR